MSVSGEKGMAFIAAVLMIVVVAFLGTALAFMLSGNVRSGAGALNAKQALYVAESGLERGIRELLTPNLANRSACANITGGINMTDIPVGTGVFTLSSATPAYPGTVVTLNAAITAAERVIPISGAYPPAGYVSAGRILVDRESIDYSAISNDATACNGAAPCLLVSERGADGTTATSHVAGAPLGQFQCDVVSQGGVPDLATPRGKRVLRQGVQLQEGWAVGANGRVLRWAGGGAGTPAWAVSASQSAVLYGVSMLSYADGWAVGDRVGGQRPLIVRWQNGVWSTFSHANFSNNELDDVYCVSSADCWAIGAASGGFALAIHWDGTQWVRITSGLPNQNAISVHCADSQSCWMVGTRNLRIRHWNSVTSNWDTSIRPGGTLYSVFMRSSTDGWALGAGGRIYRYGSSTWTSVASGTGNNLYGVTCSRNATDCWAVGRGGVIRHWTDASGAWAAVTSPTTRDLRDVVCATDSDCWASGANGTLIHWDGTQWTSAASGVTDTLYGLAIVAPDHEPQSAWEEVFP